MLYGGEHFICCKWPPVGACTPASGIAADPLWIRPGAKHVELPRS
uniref:Uncharacterized protein n=1 Tax=Arundo donax TaxID=35708 RepID=A0A0A9BP78_ARUDO